MPIRGAPNKKEGEAFASPSYYSFTRRLLSSGDLYCEPNGEGIALNVDVHKDRVTW
jgi:hypothetical protein